MKNSEYPHSEGETNGVDIGGCIRDRNISKVGKYYLSLSGFNHQVPLEFYWLTLKKSTQHTEPLRSVG